MNRNHLLGCVFFWSWFSSANEIPDDFKGLYSFHKDVIEIKSVDGITNDFEALINYNSVKISSNNARREMFKFLKKIGVKDSISKEIVNDLSKGKSSTDKCIGLANECIVVPEKYDILLDYEHKILYFYISPDLLEVKKILESQASNIDKNPAFINASSLYLGFNDSNSSITLNDESTFGMKYGYFKSDFSYSDDTDFKLRKLAYIFDYDKYIFQAGFFDGNKELNSTAFLNNLSSNTEEISLNIGSSDNLVLNRESYYNEVNYYSPSKGYLIARKEGNIVYQRNVSAGSGKIPYSSLPVGVYELEVKIRANGVDVLKKNYQIYNTKNGRLSKDKVDYIFTMGIYNKDNSSLYDFDDHIDNVMVYEDSVFIRGAVSYGVNDALMIGSEFEYNNEDKFFNKVGASYLFESGSNLDIIYGLYKDGSSSSSINLTTPWISLYFDKLVTKDDDYFAIYKEGSRSRESITANKNFSISSLLNGNISYSYGKYDLKNKENSFWNITANADYRFYAGNIISGQLMYNEYESDYDKHGEFSVNATVTIPFGDDFTYSIYGSGYDGKFDEYRSQITKEDIFADNDNLDMSVTAGHSVQTNYQDEQKGFTNISGNYSDDDVQVNMYAYADTSGDKDGSISINSNQIISSDGIDFTSSKSESYLKLNIDNDDERIENLGLLTVNTNNVSERKQFINDTDTLIPLDKYEKYKIKLDTQSVSLESQGEEEISDFVFPGTVLNLHNKVSKIVTFITAFNDVDDIEISNIECKGDGCIDIENIDGNVFSVKVRSGKEFVLHSDNLVCLTPGVRNIKKLNLGKNYCIPEISQGERAIVKTFDIKRQLYFLGVFNKNNRSLDSTSNLNLIKRRYDDKQDLVYVSFPDNYELTKSEHEIIDNILLTAKANANVNFDSFVLNLDSSWFNLK